LTRTERHQGSVLLGQPTLRTWEALAQALAVGPIASIALGGFLIAGAAGGAAPLVVSLTLGGALCLGWTVSRYARRYAGAGSVYEYIGSVLGAPVGVACAGLEFFVGPLGLGTLYLVFGVLGQQFAVAHLGINPGWWSGAVLVAVATFGLQYRGIRVAARLQLVLTALAAVPFIVCAIVVILRGGVGGNSLAVFQPVDAAGTRLFRSLLFAVLLFGGFEAAAAVGEEAERPHRSIPVAMLTAIAASGIFYIVVVYAATIGFGPDRVAAEWGLNPAGLAVLGDRYVGAPLGALMELAVLVDLVAVAGAYGNHVGRGIFALARDGLLPARLATRSRYDSPFGGLVVGFLGGMAVLVATAGLDDRIVAIEVAAVTLTLANMVVYLVLAGGALRIVSRALARSVVVVAAGALPALGIYGTLVPRPAGVGRVGGIVFAALLAVTVTWVGVLRLRRPEHLQHAAEHVLQPEPRAYP
jgi:amino acid transporter